MIVKELFAKLGLEVDEGAFSVGEKAIEILKHGLIAVGATATGAALGLVALTKKTADAGASASKSAQQAGVSTSAWQELSFAAEAVGLSSDTLQTSLRRLSRTAYEASIGSAEAGYYFNVLGISTKGANGQLKSGDELLMQLADKFQKMPDGMKKSALAMQLFGRGGAELIPFLNKGHDGLEALREEARELGIVLDSNTIAASKHFKKALHEVEAAIQGLAYAIGGPLISAFTPAFEAIALWVKENRELIAQKIHSTINSIASAARAVWTILGPLVKLISKLITSSWLWKAAFLAIGTYITLMAGQQLLALVKALQIAVFWFNAAGWAGLKAGLSALGAWMAAAAPFLAIIALAGLIFLIFEDLYTFLQGGDSLAGEFANKLWDVLPKAWDRVVGYFKQKWEDFVSWISNKLSFLSLNGAIGRFFGAGAQSPSAGADASATGGVPGVISMQIGDINVQSAPGADGRTVGTDVADAIEERQRTMLREAQAAVVGG